MGLHLAVVKLNFEQSKQVISLRVKKHGTDTLKRGADKQDGVKVASCPATI